VRTASGDEVRGMPAPFGGGGSTVASSLPMRTRGGLALAAVAAPPVEGVLPVLPAPPTPPEPDIAAWRAILDRVRPLRPALASIFEHAFPIEVSASRVVLGFEAGSQFLSARASEPEALDALTREVRSHFGAPTQVALDLSARPASGVRTVAAMNGEARAAELAKARAAIEAHPVVQEAVRLFGAHVRDVKLPDGEG
jgi:hypothetical protein